MLYKMTNALKIRLEDRSYIVINEDSISAVVPRKTEDLITIAELRMSNGDIWMCIDPPYPAWENDALKRKH